MNSVKKVNALLILSFLNILLTLIILLILVCFASYTYDLVSLAHEKKDKVNQTIDSIYNISTKIDTVIQNLTSFLEVKVINAICSSDIIRKTVGAYLCPIDNNQLNQNLTKRILYQDYTDTFLFNFILHILQNTTDPHILKQDICEKCTNQCSNF
jgi:predicted DNA-binding ribbon-helix-helix protein